MNQDSLAKIPLELKIWPNWVCWSLEMREGELTKVPKNPYTGGNAKTNDRNTWGGFDSAVKYWEAHKNNGIAGIGYVFSANDPFTGIDLDKCRNPETGEIEPWARDIITRHNSYVEISPSGRGVHIIINGRVPPGGNNKGQVEMYSQSRFFTVTGQHLEGTPTTIEKRQVALEALHTEIFGHEKREASPNPLEPSPGIKLTDDAVIAKARAQNGDKFDRLMAGDLTEYDGDDSRADLAICSLLGFWTQDAVQIDRLFRQSKLMRPKWDVKHHSDGRTYGQGTIQKALAGLTETYQGSQAGGSYKNEEEQPQTSLIPRWPQEVMTGAAGHFARAYANYLETPECFLFMSYLTVLGHVVGDKVILASEIKPQPRLYIVLLGESADTRKSTSINKTIDFFGETLGPGVINPVMGVGSAEGLAEAIKKSPKVLLVLDEFKALIQKCQIDGSVLLPCINTLFEGNTYHNHTKKNAIMLNNAKLSLVAACTLDTYQTMFNSQFQDIGFPNRLFVVIGSGQRKFATPKVMPDNDKEPLKCELREILAFVEQLSAKEPYAIPIDPEAEAIFNDWYFSLEPSVHTKRLDTYGHRLMLLLAVNEMKNRITPDIAEKTVALLNYQLRARLFADPIDADNTIARVEEKMRRILATGSRSKSDLEKYGHKKRVGNWIWKMALRNLTDDGEVEVIRPTPKRIIYRLRKEEMEPLPPPREKSPEPLSPSV